MGRRLKGAKEDLWLLTPGRFCRLYRTLRMGCGLSCTIERDESAVDWGRKTEYRERDVNVR